jgi:hypothetical protein
MRASTIRNKTARMTGSALMVTLVASLSGCFSLHAYQTEALGSARPAQVIGDYHLRAGALVNVFLRSVDDRPLRVWQHSAEVDAGAHRLLVDCEVTATGKLSRHSLNVSLENGVRYRLTAEASDQQGCTQVNLEEFD